MSNQPNIVMIMSDEHDPAVMGCYGDDLVHTPNFDRLAEEGVVFDDAYCNSPLCVPSRLSFTAGQYISRCGAWSNNCWLPSDEYPSLPRVLRRAGYRPFLCGKQHYDAQRRYGFIDLLPEGPCNQHHKGGTGVRREADDTSPNFKSWENRSSKFYAGDDSYILNHDRTAHSKSLEFLSDQGEQEEPFFLFVGHLAPHFPLIVPEPYYEKYKGRVPMPKIPEGFLEELPTNYKHLRYGFGLTETEADTVQKGRDLYWAFVDWYDDLIGELLDAIESSDVARDTVVIYTSDHGEDKGDHGLWWKNCMYEHAARVPLIVRYPERWSGGQRRKGACSLVDLVQTIVGLAEAEAPPDWDGDSMVQWMDDADTDWKDVALSEYYAHNIASGFTMLRQGAHKYVYHNRMDEEHGPERELYNLESDPGEFDNLAADPEHTDRIRRMHSAMVEELGEDPEDIERRCREDYARGYGR
ncbi:MAG: sulfatase-like hydrolase/transferase [Planctomycetes bacterium]|nr:sulfatase-like hydrolase/transferase [Planctomycetota bacterium]